jgi:regulator of RNase E activity RraA
MSAELVETLRSVSSCTVSTVLLKQGLRNVWMRGPKPLTPEQPRAVGRAFTMRFIPARGDMKNPPVTRDIVEDMPAGAMIVADSRAVTDVATFGDIVVTRIAKRGISGIVTDGAVRDRNGLLATGLPIWCAGVTAPPPVAGHILAGWQQPISCGGVTVYPDDFVLADAEGAVVIPAALAAQAAEAAVKLEQEDERLLGEVRRGVPLNELYPAKKQK